MNLIWVEDFKSSVTQSDPVELLSLRWHLDWLPRVPFYVFRVSDFEPLSLETSYEFQNFYRFSLSDFLNKSEFRGEVVARVRIIVESAVAPTVRAVTEDGAFDEIVLISSGGNNLYSGVLTVPGMTDLEITCAGKAAIRLVNLWLVKHVLQVVENESAELMERVGLPIEFNPDQGYENSSITDPIGALMERFRLAAQLGSKIDYKETYYRAWESFGTDLLGILRRTDDRTLENSIEAATVEIKDIPLKVGEKEESIESASSSPVLLFDFLSLGATTYSPMSLILGYGTNIEEYRSDYSIDESFYVVVVSAQNKPYIYNSFGQLDILFASVAAAVHAPPSAPTSLAAKSKFLRRDETSTRSLYQTTLSWDRPDLQPLPLSYRVVDSTGRQHLTEEHGPFYLPADPDQAASARAHFDSNPITVEIKDEEIRRDYLVAATDVHDRWSDDVQVNCVFTRQDPQTPVLKGISHEYQQIHRTGDVVQATLYIELSWNWDESLPKIIEVKAKFPPDAVEHLIHMVFETADYLELPMLRNNSLKSLRVQPIVPSQDPAVGTLQDSIQPRLEHNIQTYRIIFERDIEFDGSASATVEVSVRAQEQNRQRFSGFTEPMLYSLTDPRPAAVPEVNADIYYTEAPDLTGWARITWPFGKVSTTDTRIQGYAIYEASEQALLVAGGEERETSLQHRANKLLELHDNSSLDTRLRTVYTRKYPELITSSAASSFQLEVPANLDRLYVFRCSTVTHANIESALSKPIFVTLPTQVNLSPPKLSLIELKNNKASLKLRQDNPLQVGYLKLYRVQTDALKNGSFGPAHIRVDAVDIATPIEDELPPSWRPYHYRAIAFSEAKSEEGLLAGQGDASNLITINNFPSAPPEIIDVQHEHLENGLLRIQFKVRDAGTLGKHHLTLSTVSNDMPLPVEYILIDASYEGIKTAFSTEQDQHVDQFSIGNEDEIEARLQLLFMDYPLVLIITITDELQRSNTATLQVDPPKNMPSIYIMKVGPITHSSLGPVLTFVSREPLSALGEANTPARLVIISKLNIRANVKGEIRLEPPMLSEIIDSEDEIERFYNFSVPLHELDADGTLIAQTLVGREDDKKVEHSDSSVLNTENSFRGVEDLRQLRGLDVSSGDDLDSSSFYPIFTSGVMLQGVSDTKGFSRYKFSIGMPYVQENSGMVTATIINVTLVSITLHIQIKNRITDQVRWKNPEVDK